MNRFDLEALVNRAGPSSQDVLDMNAVSQAIIEADGDLALVAERLLGSKARQDEVLSLLTTDASSLEQFAAKLRAYALVKTMSMFSALGYHVMLTMSEIKPADAIKAYIQLAQAMESLTKAQNHATTNNLNIYETIMGQVPAPVAEALKVIIQNPPQSTGSNGSQHVEAPGE